jgi:hypothetical protein
MMVVGFIFSVCCFFCLGMVYRDGVFGEVGVLCFFFGLGWFGSGGFCVG